MRPSSPAPDAQVPALAGPACLDAGAAGSRRAVPGRPAGPNGTGIDPVTHARLWENPCWFAFRFNYLALSYNIPLYGWIEREHGLPRPEYVVLYSLGLKDGVAARDIAISYGFPKTSLSRAVNALERKGLVQRARDPADGRSFLLALTDAGRALFDATLPRFVEAQDSMLRVLTEAQRETLSVLLAKIVLGTFAAAPDGIEPPSASPRRTSRANAERRPSRAPSPDARSV